MRANITLLLVNLVLSATALELKDCEADTSECCDLVLNSIQINNFNFKGSCQSYRNEREENGETYFDDLQSLKINFKCTGWVCDCPNIQEKFQKAVNKMSLRALDSHCGFSSSSTTGTSWIVVFVLFFLYLIFV
eukprot:GFUD01069547.1.p1 GENE.GFUD01069547.1~~GFUD01069547.1.p1  ORF type:complete len:134 (-),score=20.22 GFUD01069547.1:70-471(-)